MPDSSTFVHPSSLSSSAFHRTLTRLSIAWQSCDSFLDLKRSISSRPCRLACQMR